MLLPRLLMSVALALLALPVSAQSSLGCDVVQLRGAAEVVTGETRRRIETGTLIAFRDRIETGGEAFVVLLCPSDLSITIGPSSVVELFDATEDTSGWAAWLPNGIARFARPVLGRDRFEVRTPSAVASVRSTVWTMEVVDEATQVFVSEGVVDVASDAAAAALRAGDGIAIARDGTTDGPVPWDPAQIAALYARLGVPAK